MSTASAHSATGCGGPTCACAEAGKARPAPAAINGIQLHDGDEHLDVQEVQERAWAELLRQEAVKRGLLPRVAVLLAPDLNARDHDVIQTLLDEAVPAVAPSDDECLRYYQANKPRYVEGHAVHARHILFAVTERVDVGRLAARAQEALLELQRKGTPATRWSEMARELSNCPSGAAGGDLGWISPEDCADELRQVLFHQNAPAQATGLQPRLVHSRYGLHIVEILARREGRQAPFAQVKERVGAELAQRARATALHQYIRQLAGRAIVEGVDLEGAASPLTQ